MRDTKQEQQARTASKNSKQEQQARTASKNSKQGQRKDKDARRGEEKRSGQVVGEEM